MNKLQLYIYKSLRGFKAVRNINPAEKVQRHIHDMRRALEILDYDAREKYLFYMLSYISEGAFLTILRTIPDQPFDHLATTIFVPCGLQISVEELSGIVQRTTRMVANPAVTADELSELHSLFAREYPVSGEPTAMAPSAGREYAWCRYGGNTGRRLEDFYGALYQTAYLPYEGVVLVDAELGVESVADDLSGLELTEHVPLLPPAGNVDGFQPYIYQHPFKQPFLVPLGGEVDILWRRAGFEDRRQEITVERAGQQLEPIAVDDSRKTISPASFFITSHSSRQPVTDARVTVNGREINDGVAFTLSDLRSAEVVVTAPGYAPFSTHCDLAATTQALIQLPEARKVYRFEMPVRSSELGAPIHFEIHTKRELHESPLEGYSLNAAMQEGANRVNHLQYTGAPTATERRKQLFTAVASLLAGILLGWAVSALTAGGDSAPQPAAEDTLTTKAQPTATAAKPETPAATPAATPAVATDYSAAVAYLDGNKNWRREEMEKTAGLAGLFDDLNNYNYERLINTWKPRLKASGQWQKVITAVENGRRKKKFTPAAGATYCGAGDTSISYINYTYKVDP